MSAPVLANRVFLWFGFRCYMRLLDVDLPSHTLVSGLAGDTRAILSQCALLFWALRDSSREANLADLGFIHPVSCFNLAVFVLLILTPWFPCRAYVMVNLVLQISVHSCSAEAG